MGRATQAIGFLLIGATAAAGGTGFFLYRANVDRAVLVQRSEDARAKADEAARASQLIADEANRKLEAASQEVSKAQERIRVMEDEARLLAMATPLTRPKSVATWKEWVSVPLGFSVRLPPTAEDPVFATTTFASNWLSVMRFDPEVVTSTEAVYLVQGHLLAGVRTPTSWRFRVQSNGTSTLTIIAYPNQGASNQMMLDALSTLTFRE